MLQGISKGYYLQGDQIELCSWLVALQKEVASRWGETLLSGESYSVPSAGWFSTFQTKVLLEGAAGEG